MNTLFYYYFVPLHPFEPRNLQLGLKDIFITRTLNPPIILNESFVMFLLQNNQI